VAHVALGPEEPVATPAPREPGATPRATARSSTAPAPARTIGWISLGVGAAGIALAGASGLVLIGDRSTLADPDHCNARKECDAVGLSAARSARTWLVVNTVAWAASLTGITVEGLLLLSSSGSPAQVEVGLVPAAGGAALDARGRF
jgi:hypothetical protein